MKNKKTPIHNVFFDTGVLGLSFLVSPLRSVIFFLKKPANYGRNIFFDLLDFIFRKWPRYFWSKPSAYKLFGYIGNICNYLLGNKK